MLSKKEPRGPEESSFSGFPGAAQPSPQKTSPRRTKKETEQPEEDE